MKALVFLVGFLSTAAFSQPNCNAYKWMGDSTQYKACTFTEKRIGRYYQFSREFHKMMDSALAICPHFAYAWREKSAAYVKSGNFLEWKKLIDKAVELEPAVYLPVRISLRYKFFADYKGALKDLEELAQKTNGNVGQSSNGTYHLNVVKALCLKALGKRIEAISVLEAHFKNEPTNRSLYDYLHLGVLYLETGNLPKALEYLEKQIATYTFAENHFYLALCYKQSRELDKFRIHLLKAQELMLLRKCIFDEYNELFDQVYLDQIIKEIKVAEGLSKK